MKITSRKASNVLGAGKHVVTIVGIAEDVSSAGYAQIKMSFKDAKGGVLTHYFNTVGFEKNEDGSYKTDRKGQRIISEEMSEKCLDILGKLAYNTGIEESDEEFDIQTLMNAEVGIAVEMEIATTGASEGKAFPRVKYTFTPEVLEASF